MAIPLIVPVLNRFDLFTRMVNSIDVEIKPYVMNNYDTNYGVSSAWNKGIAAAIKDKYRYAIISNDDVVFSSKSLQSLYDSLIDSDAVMIGANSEKDICGHGKITQQQVVDLCKEKKIKFRGDTYCFAIDMQTLVKKCGWFDENFFPAYFEDVDMKQRIKLANLKRYIDTNVYIYHHGSKTQTFDPKKPVVSEEVFSKNAERYVNKWGGLEGYEKYNTPFNDPNLNIKDW